MKTDSLLSTVPETVLTNGRKSFASSHSTKVHQVLSTAFKTTHVSTCNYACDCCGSKTKKSKARTRSFESVFEPFRKERDRLGRLLEEQTEGDFGDSQVLRHTRSNQAFSRQTGLLETTEATPVGRQALPKVLKTRQNLNRERSSVPGCFASKPGSPSFAVKMCLKTDAFKRFLDEFEKRETKEVIGATKANAKKTFSNPPRIYVPKKEQTPCAADYEVCYSLVSKKVLSVAMDRMPGRHNLQTSKFPLQAQRAAVDTPVDSRDSKNHYRLKSPFFGRPTYLSDDGAKKRSKPRELMTVSDTSLLDSEVDPIGNHTSQPLSTKKENPQGVWKNHKLYDLLGPDQLYEIQKGKLRKLRTDIGNQVRANIMLK